MKQQKKSHNHVFYSMSALLVVFTIGMLVLIAALLLAEKYTTTSTSPTTILIETPTPTINQYTYTSDGHTEEFYDIFGVVKKSTVGTITEVTDDSIYVLTVNDEMYELSTSADTFISKKDDPTVTKDNFELSDLDIGDTLRFSFSVGDSDVVVADEIVIL